MPGEADVGAETLKEIQMNAFSQYASFYDQLYQDKDYHAETTFVEQLIHRHTPGSRSILDLGCGTARHAVEFAQRGYRVDGVDLSPQMVKLAQMRLQGLPAEIQQRLRIFEGDVSQYVSATKYAVVTALFHVACYQTSNRALKGLFRSVRGALDHDGTFIFDFWYGPAVLSDRPVNRVKRVTKEGMHIARLAEPVLHADRNIVEVTYTLTVVDGQTGHANETREVHAMRYLFLPELELLADDAGLELVETGQWLNGNPLNTDSWLGYGIARAKR
jgi:SAM-dependent methyltransferase